MFSVRSGCNVYVSAKKWNKDIYEYFLLPFLFFPPTASMSYLIFCMRFYGFTVLRLCIWQMLLQKIIYVLIGFDQLKLSLGIELMFYCLSCRNVFRKLWQATKLMGFSRNADLEPCRRKTKKVGEWSFLIFWQEDYGAGAQQETDELLHAR